VNPAGECNVIAQRVHDGIVNCDRPPGPPRLEALGYLEVPFDLGQLLPYAYLAGASAAYSKAMAVTVNTGTASSKSPLVLS
jgi:hypothetical protein